MTIRLIGKFIICSVAAVIMVGCATTTPKDHAERNGHINLAYLLGEEPLSAEDQAELVGKYIQVATTALERKEYTKARRAASRALSFQPGRYDAELILAEVELGQGFNESAVERFKALNDVSPAAVTLQGLGLAMINQGNYQTGRKHLQQAVELDPTLWRALNGVGVSYAVEKNWDESDKAYQRALDVNAASPQIYNNLGLSYLQRGKYELALKALSQALAQPYGVAVADENYRLAQALNGEMDMAMQGLDDVNRAILLNNLGQTAMGDKEYRKAISFFKSALKAHPNYFVEAEQNLDVAMRKFN